MIASGDAGGSEKRLGSRLPASTARSLVVVLTIVTVLWGCRAPVEVEGDLPVGPFEHRLASLTQDPGGQWYVVAIRGQSPGPFLTVEHDGQTHLFVTRRKGNRSAKLLPLTRPEPVWMEEAYDGQPTLEFHDELRHRTVESTLGLWRGGEASEVRWLGPRPEITQRAVVVPVPRLSEATSLPSLIRGLTYVGNDGVVHTEGDLRPDDGPYLLIPDGPLSEHSPRAVSLVDDLIVDRQPQGWSLESLAGPNVASAADLSELAGRHSVEVVMASQDDDIRIGFAADGGAPRRGAWSRKVALAESGFLLTGPAREEVVQAALRAVDDLYRNHPLSAAYHLQQIKGRWSVDQNRVATKLRHQDLVAAGGYLAWMRAAHLESSEGMGPELSLYLARAYAYANHWEAVLDYGERAVRLFGHWSPEQGAMGAGRTRLMMADAYLATGEKEDALKMLELAFDDFLIAGDAYRAALVRRRLLLKGAFDDVDAVVRSFQEAGATYEASRTLLLAAAGALEENELDVAGKWIDHWTDRFGEDAPARLVWLARAVQVRMQWLRGDGVAERISDWEVESENSRAWEALLTFALTQHQWRSMHDEVDLERLGRLLVAASTRSYSDIFTAEIHSTLATLCTDLLFGRRVAREEGIGRYCDEHIRTSVAMEEGITSLLEGGYRFLQRSELAAAERVESFIVEALPEDDHWPAAQAKTYLYRAALAEELRMLEASPAADEEPVVAALQGAFEVLDEYLPAEDAPRLLMEFGELFDLRAMDRISLALYGAAVDAARTAELDRETFESSLEFARACHRAGAWEKLAGMDNVDSPLHAARIDLYRAHAKIVKGKGEEGAALKEGVMEAVEEFGALQRLGARELAARLAMERDDVESAREQLAGALSELDDFPEGLRERNEARSYEAGLAVTNARLRVLEGDAEGAQEEADKAMEMVRRLDDATGHRDLEMRAFRVAIAVAERSEHREELIEELQERSRLWSNARGSRERRDVSRLLMSYDIASGDSERAIGRLRSVLGEGLGVTSSRREHHCVLAETKIQAGEEPGEFHLHNCQGAADEPGAVWVQLLAALAVEDSGLVSYRRELALHLTDILPTKSSGEAKRMRWLVEFVAPVVEDDEGLVVEVESRFSHSRAGVDPDDPDRQRQWTVDERINAATEYAELLIDSGRYAEAQERLLDAGSLGRWYFVEELDSEDLWLLLRARLATHSLQPFAVLRYTEEALQQQDVQMKERRAQFHYYRGAAHLQLGHVFAAEGELQTARELVEDSAATVEKIDQLESVVRAVRSGR